MKNPILVVIAVICSMALWVALFAAELGKPHIAAYAAGGFMLLIAIWWVAIELGIRADNWEAHGRRKLHVPDPGETFEHWLTEMVSWKKISTATARQWRAERAANNPYAYPPPVDAIEKWLHVMVSYGKLSINAARKIQQEINDSAASVKYDGHSFHYTPEEQPLVLVGNNGEPIEQEPRRKGTGIRFPNCNRCDYGVRHSHIVDVNGKILATVRE